MFHFTKYKNIHIFTSPATFDISRRFSISELCQSFFRVAVNALKTKNKPFKLPPRLIELKLRRYCDIMNWFKIFSLNLESALFLLNWISSLCLLDVKETRMATTTIRTDRNFTILCLCVSSELIFLNVKIVHIRSSLYWLSTTWWSRFGSEVLNQQSLIKFE